MRKMIAFLSIAILSLCSCGDKVTNVYETKYVNSYYDCVGVWVAPVIADTFTAGVDVKTFYSDTTRDTIILNANKSWRVMRLIHSISWLVSNPAFIRDNVRIVVADSGDVFVQNNSTITLLKKWANGGYSVFNEPAIMMDSSTMCRQYSLYYKVK